MTTDTILGNFTQKKKQTLSVCMLASGSRGNAIYVSDNLTSILIDAGLSGVEIERRMASRGFSPEGLSAILVTHEHSDHIQGVGVLSRRYNLPVYISKRTKQSAAQIGKIKDAINFECGSPFNINGLSVHPFSTSHDAKDPAGFTISQKGIKIGIATDLGKATAMVRECLQECRLLILEANHDPVMLEQGPYPWHVKERVKSRHGHLSNEESMRLLYDLKHDRLSHVVLAHLSQTNNTPEKAFSTVSKAIDSGQTQLTVAMQDRCSEIITIE